MAKPLYSRFWDKVLIAEGCWLWQASTLPGGYGAFRYNGRMHTASFVAFELSKGLVPKGMHACHTCDNPKCVKPTHLFLGTPKQNTADMIKKGRHNPHGIKNKLIE